jgi:hypothetical protein
VGYFDQQASLHFVSEAWVSLNWSFNNKQLFQKASMKKKLFPESFLAGKDSTK